MIEASEIPIRRQRERPRDRRGGHHQDVRLSSLLAQASPLADAEPVLLVDDDEPKALEERRGLEDGVRPDHQLRASRGHRGQGGAPRRASLAAREEHRLERRPRQARGDGPRVLLREQFCRREQHGLQAVGHDDHCGQERDHRLAGADVALEEAVHGRGALQVVHDLLQRVALPGRERKRQHLARQRADGIGDLDAVRLGRLGHL